MKMISILLTVAVLNGHFQKVKVEKALVGHGPSTAELNGMIPVLFPYGPSCAYNCLYESSDEASQTFHTSPDKVVNGLGLLQVVCAWAKCVFPTVEQEMNTIISAEQKMPSAIPGNKEYQFETPGMLSGSIRE